MTIHLSVCLLAELCKYYWSDLHEKNEKMLLGPTSIQLKFRSDPDHRLDTKTDKRSRFSHLLIESFKNIML